ANAALTIYTTMELVKDKVSERDRERVHTNLVLRFMGETHGVLTPDRANQEYLIGAITGMSGSYELDFSSPKTPRSTFDYYLSFARAFGLNAVGATSTGLLPLFPTTASGANNFGKVTAEYNVRFTDAGLRRLFGAPFNEVFARNCMRKLILANYVLNPA